MELGAFSVSLSVKDIEASKAFYEKLGFHVFGGDASQNWLIMKNGDHIIGLFQGMFEKNILTFNPGWDQDANPLDSFTDVRELQKALKEQGVSIENEADESTTGPASFVVVDPDGNPILIDQHVQKSDLYEKSNKNETFGPVMPACFERKSIFVAPDGWMLAKEFGHDGPFGQTFCFQTNPGIHSLITSIGSSARNRGSVRTQVFLEHETGKLPIIPADDNRTVLGDINARRN